MELRNSYDPFGNLLSNQTIYNPKPFISRDDVLYDPEISLYYMHARYYDPEADRFIMKDPIEGSPITHGFRIKCGMTKRRSANDLVNKIDPAGTTPQNTGLPERYENEPQEVKWAGSNRTAFCTPNGLIGSVVGEEALIYTPQPENLGNDVWEYPDDAMDTFDSCGGRKLVSWKVYNRYGQVIAEDKGDGDGPIFYEIDEEGSLLDKNGKIIDPYDKDYENKRIESKDISKTLKQIEDLANLSGKSPLGTYWVSGEAWDSEGNRTNVIIAYKQSNGNWRGFTIENTERDPRKPGALITVRSFYEDNDDRKIKQIEDIFEEIGVEFEFDVPSGSFLVMEVIDIKIKREGKEIESYTYTIKQPILYRKIGCSLRPKTYILKWNIDLITPHMLFWHNKLIN